MLRPPSGAAGPDRLPVAPIVLWKSKCLPAFGEGSGPSSHALDSGAASNGRQKCGIGPAALGVRLLLLAVSFDRALFSRRHNRHGAGVLPHGWRDGTTDGGRCRWETARTAIGHLMWSPSRQGAIPFRSRPHLGACRRRRVTPSPRLADGGPQTGQPRFQCGEFVGVRGCPAPNRAPRPPQPLCHGVRLLLQVLDAAHRSLPPPHRSRPTGGSLLGAQAPAGGAGGRRSRWAESSASIRSRVAAFSSVV